MKVVVLHDMVPPEATPDLADNLVQARQVLAALGRLGCRAQGLAFGPEVDQTRQALEELRPDVVFNLVETPLGMARMIHLAPLLLERLRLRYTGAGARGMLLTSQKLLAKKAMRDSNLPTPDWCGPRDDGLPFSPLRRYIVKSVWEHGSVGLDDHSIIKPLGRAAMRAAIAQRGKALGGDCFAEAYIEGREFNIAILAGSRGPEMLPPAEITFEGFQPGKPHIVGYRAKWVEDSHEYNHTPRRFDFEPRDAELLARLKAMSLRCWRLFGLRGWARVDFRVDRKGRPFILEVNANPCLADDAGFMAAACRAGLDQTIVVWRILGSASRGRRRGCAVEKTGLA